MYKDRNYWKYVRGLCEERGMKYTTVKQRLYTGLDLELALLENPYDFIHRKEKEEQEKLKNKPMMYWIVKDHKITKELRTCLAQN